MLRKEYPPEFVPPAQRHETDVRNFEREFTDEQVNIDSHGIVIIVIVRMI